MKIQVRNLQNLKKVNLSKLKIQIKKILRLLRREHNTVYIVLVDNATIKELNKLFLRKSYPTDVLAFPLDDKYSQDLLGEVIVSVEQAGRNSRRYRTSWEKELVLCVIHGILHLVGYDDNNATQRAKMQRKEKDLLKVFFPS